MRNLLSIYKQNQNRVLQHGVLSDIQKVDADSVGYKFENNMVVN